MMKSWGEEFQSFLTASMMHSVNSLKGIFSTKFTPPVHCFRRVATSCQARYDDSDLINKPKLFLHHHRLSETTPLPKGVVWKSSVLQHSQSVLLYNMWDRIACSVHCSSNAAQMEDRCIWRSFTIATSVHKKAAINNAVIFPIAV